MVIDLHRVLLTRQSIIEVVRRRTTLPTVFRYLYLIREADRARKSVNCDISKPNKSYSERWFVIISKSSLAAPMPSL